MQRTIDFRQNKKKRCACSIETNSNFSTFWLKKVEGGWSLPSGQVVGKWRPCAMDGGRTKVFLKKILFQVVYIFHSMLQVCNELPILLPWWVELDVLNFPDMSCRTRPITDTKNVCSYAKFIVVTSVLSSCWGFIC